MPGLFDASFRFDRQTAAARITVVIAGLDELLVDFFFPRDFAIAL